MRKLSIIVAILLIHSFIDAQSREDYNLRGERYRLRDGINHGEITKREARQIHQEMRDVRVVNRSAVSDGIITPRERMYIARQDRQLDRTLYRVKHNRRRI